MQSPAAWWIKSNYPDQTSLCFPLFTWLGWISLVSTGTYGCFFSLPKSAGTDMQASMKKHEPRKFTGEGSSTPSSKSANIIKAGGSINAKKRYFFRVWIMFTSSQLINIRTWHIMSKTPVKRGRPAGMRARQLELKQTLLEHPDVQRCLRRSWVQHWMMSMRTKQSLRRYWWIGSSP